MRHMQSLIVSSAAFQCRRTKRFGMVHTFAVMVSANIRCADQPFEYLAAGGYLGEIVRLILIEATDDRGLYGGDLPCTLRQKHSLDTKTLARIELDESTNLTDTMLMLRKQYPSVREPSFEDANFIRQTALAVTTRSIAYWSLGVSVPLHSTISGTQ